MKKTYVWHGALLSMTAAAFAVGCGGAGAPSDPSSSEQGSAAITAIAPAVVSGCNLTMAFDIVAPENIGFIAVQNLNKAVSNSSSALNNMQLTLYQLDNESRLVQVNKQATEVDSALSAVLNEISQNAQFARQSSSATQLNDSHYAQFTDINRQLAATTTTSTTQNEILNQNTTSEHFAKHAAEAENESEAASKSRASAANVNKNAVEQEAAFSAASSAKEASQSSAFAANNSLLDVNSAFTELGIDPSAFLSQVFSNFAKQAASESAFAAQNVSQASEVAARQAAASATNQEAAAFEQQAARTRAASEDHVIDNTNTHLDHAVSASQTTSTDQVLKETTAIVTDQRVKAAAASDNIAENRDFASNFVNQQEKSQARQSAFGFTNLENLQSNHFILKVDVAASEREAAFQLFQGLNDSVFANTSFAQELPACIDP